MSHDGLRKLEREEPARGRDCHNVSNVLKQHRLIAINTHFDDRYTFYNSSGSGRSRIDFVCMPQELFEAVSHAGICVGAGRRLQLVNVSSTV